ncbi:ETS homologous factor-like isoform X2 [Zootermopsis nevadensis]|uniref:ETS homologous factor-like isoform X2 n=1 Tax=Zootermopsis nevadensis TaxID=136037 RepID=UPI000B8E9BB0|nr:ETS homologous factor-like isoform X2 [Zootermopsis nevadensis]
MQQVSSGYLWHGDVGREIPGRWGTVELAHFHLSNGNTEPYTVIPPSSSRGREVDTMPFGNVLMQFPLQQSANELDETYEPRWEDPNNYLASIWTRDETNSWENSESSEYFVHSTAVNKQLAFPNDCVNTDWKTKSVKQWESNDIMCWIISVANKNDLNSEEIGISQFNDIDGATLYSMSEADFVSRESQHGKFLFSTLQQLKQEQEHQQVDNINKLPPVSTIKPDERDYYPLLMNLNSASTSRIEGHQSSDESEGGIHGIPPSVTGKRRPGRPRIPGRRSKKPEKKTGRLWEFIRDLLLNREYCPSLICWENHDEGVFRFVRSEKVAKLWGSLKENPKMTYEKLSRAMRYYYRSKVLQPVLGRRLVYKFGPTATGWQTPNPNFRV